MKLPKANLQIVINFLQLKGWTFDKSDDLYSYFLPPKEMKFEEPNFRFLLPANEEAIDYKEYVTQRVFSLAELYHVDKTALLNLLSKSPEQLLKEAKLAEREAAFKKNLLALSA